MAERFFTNALSLGGALSGPEQIPYDIPAGGSAFTTPAQISTYVKASLDVQTCQYSADSSTSGFTASGSEVAGVPNLVVLDLTGTLGAPANIQMPTASAIVAALPGAFIGQTYILRILNNSSANFPWTLTTNTGITLNGTMTIAQNTWREWLVTLTSLSAIALQNIGSGDN